MMKIQRLLVACEESQRVCTAFRAKGWEAYSCDIIDCSGEHPEWHIKQDVLPLLNGNCTFKTCDGTRHDIVGRWDMIIAHPPCTYLSNVHMRGFSLKCTPPEKIFARHVERLKAAVFFMRFVSADCPKIAIENPVGCMNTVFRKADQIIDPYYFASDTTDSENYVQKRTCFWLKGLPALQRKTFLEKPAPIRSYINANGKNKNVGWEMAVSKDRSRTRSKTFLGIAAAMAEQWGNVT